ncbi:hypothetical protein PLESTB_001575400 [Pleodorina starrii]|uniref:Uncharacterized protein n=1 Tax=Pleodorina starrii TaxID=330485 RepID=A0A9W6BXN1_9CHLO|nr:hypothetical protein PLESTM_000880800 [Pleodorina starrii]GLC60113.1 hypothetical protein PLESTB_001575400 [Pleodorina starrii]GLC68987.1 hypothetical protein PLESTF_000766600 [Pleodorina starrii]
MYQDDPYAHPVVHVRTLPPKTAPEESFVPVHYKLDQGPMEVSYGFDGPSVQYFLTAADTRLRWQADAPLECNQAGASIGFLLASAGTYTVCRALFPGGSGCYLALHTGPNGTGRRVSVAALAEFWERYGVPSDHVEALRQGRNKF